MPIDVSPGMCNSMFEGRLCPGKAKYLTYFVNCPYIHCVHAGGCQGHEFCKQCTAEFRAGSIEMIDDPCYFSRPVSGVPEIARITNRRG
jgi:hypothetical protein